VAVVALAVVTATAIAGSRGGDASRSGNGSSTSASTSMTAWAPPDVLTIWPENPVTADVTDPGVAQRSADQGDPGVRWRTDPKAVARRFAAAVLGWSDPVLVEVAAQTDVSLRRYDMTPCVPDIACDIAPAVVALTLGQPATPGPGGIWSVLAASSGPLRIDVPSDGPAELAAGTDLAFHLAAPRSANVHIGLVAANGCGHVSEFEPGLSSGPATFVVPDVPSGDGCGEMAAGYAYAYAQDATVVPVGDPLLESAPIAFPYLTIVPVLASGSPPA
jgi:hypothetical protein